MRRPRLNGTSSRPATTGSRSSWSTRSSAVVGSRAGSHLDGCRYAQWDQTRLDRERRRIFRRAMLTQAAITSMPGTVTHGAEESRGRLKVACAEATGLSDQMAAASAARAATEPARRSSGTRELANSPSRESTRSGEIPDTPGGPFSSNTSNAEANGALFPSLARTAARSALSSARSAYRSHERSQPGEERERLA